MATRFEPLNLGVPEVLGIKMHGAFSRGDNRRLLNLAARCLERDKTRLILDCRDLDSLGGGGAQVLADLQSRLVEREGEAVFVAVGEIIRRFLEVKFEGLPLRCYPDQEAALAALRGEVGLDELPLAARRQAAQPSRDAQRQAAKEPVKVPVESGPAATLADADKPAAPDRAPTAAVAPEPNETPAALAAAPPAVADRQGLDVLLDTVQPDPAAPDPAARHTADLMTAVYVSLDDMLQTARRGGNPTVLGEALSILLDSHDLAAETIFCHQQGDRYVAGDGRVRLPAEGGIVASLIRTRRPLTLLDLENGDLWDEETELLEDLQPDLILPLIRAETLLGVAFLQRGGEDREYGISEIFALDILLRLLIADEEQAPADAAGAEVKVSVPPVAPGQESLLAAKLELARGLHDAQDAPHFWQILIARLRAAAEVTSLFYLDSEDPQAVPFLAGESRRGLESAAFSGERIRAFFRTLERPVEIVNMPASLQAARDALLGCGLHWLVGLRADDRTYLGVAALGLNWRCQPSDVAEEIHEMMDIASEAMQRLREGQSRADMTLSLLESLLVEGAQPGQSPDAVTGQTLQTVRLLAAELGLPPDQVRDLSLGALLRNHGQELQGLDDLLADKLTGEDWEAFRSHPDHGDQILAALKAPAAVRDAVRHHHERFDGRGFPLGLRARDIPLAARLVSLAQHHALHLVRHGAEAALKAVQAEAGQALDPDLVAIFVKASRRLQTIPVSS